MPLIAAGALVILLPGLLLALLKLKGIGRAALILPAMFRNTGNLGIPLMVLAFGEQQLGAIVILFVLSNLLHFSVGMFILSANTSRWLWLRSPVLWAALAGLLVANLHITLPECNPPPRMKNRELVKTSGRWRDKLRNGGACGVMRLNKAV